MAIFTDDPNNFQRVDYHLLQNGFATLYYRPEILAGDVQWLEEHSYRIDFLDCSEWQEKRDALFDIGQKLDFPDYYGRNLDAFNDCLSDVEIPFESGRVIVLNRFDIFVQESADLACAILDIIADNSRWHLLFGKRLITLVQSNNPNIDADLNYPKIGATSLMWNRREWLNERRNISEIFN